jgi:hypothetical protein
MNISAVSPWFIGFLVMLGSIAYISRYLPGYSKNNPIEEASEKVIKDSTGFDIDFAKFGED